MRAARFRSGGGSAGVRIAGVVMVAGMVAAMAVPVVSRTVDAITGPPPPAAAPTKAPKLPVVFEEAEGAEPGTGFVARGAGLRLALRPTEASFSIGEGAESTAWLRLEGANAGARLDAVDPQQARSNYFLGNDPAQWRTNVATYGQVVSRGVYPGIDLAWHGAGAAKDGLEYDFLVAPGADPGPIALTVGGATSLAVDAKGDLVARLAGGHTLRQHKPVAYQVDAAGRRVAVDAAFRLDGHRVGFDLGAYDPARQLVIDPVLAWSSYLGGSVIDIGNSIALDADGNVYVAGNTSSSNFPVTNGSVRAGGSDFFVSKFDPTGATLLYSTFVGGSSTDVNNLIGGALTVSPTGMVYLVGHTQSPNFPTVNPQDVCPPVASSLDTEVAVFKLDPAGSTLVYSTCLGGLNKADAPTGGGALDTAGNLYVAGFTDSTEFPTKNNAAFGLNGVCLGHAGDPQVSELRDAFVLKLNAAGTLKYSTCWGGLKSDEARGLAVDAAGTAYVVGWTNSTSLPLKRAAGVQTTKQAEETGWVMKVSAQTYQAPLPRDKFSTYLGFNDTTQATDVFLKGPYVYVAGTTRGSDLATQWPDASTGAYQTVRGGIGDAFVARLRFDTADPHAPIMDRVTYLGGTSGEQSVNMVVRLGSVWLAGATESADFPMVDPLAGTACAPVGGPPPADPYVARLNPTLTTLSFSTCIGGTGSLSEEARSIAVDAAGNAFVTGFTRAADFPVTTGANDTTFNGSTDAWVAKISPDSP